MNQYQSTSPERPDQSISSWRSFGNNQGIKNALSHVWALPFRSLLFTNLKRIKRGKICVHDASGIYTFGVDSDLRADVHLHHPLALPFLIFRGSVGAGEAFMRGYWSCDNLTDLIRIFTRNDKVFSSMDSGLNRLTEPFDRILHFLRRNSRLGSRKNIQAHYDLGNDFFSLMLDPTMMYSCAYFENEEDSLYQASLNKLSRICRKLELSPDDHLLEIGTGWGGMAIYAAQEYGCQVTTTTISEEQLNLAQKRIAELGLSDRVTVLKRDYRDLRGRFDKLVSVEMIEAVGHHYWDTYFERCSELVRPGGRFLLQSITISEKYFRRALNAVDFIKRYIFPGSCIPAVSRLKTGLERAGFRVKDIDDITLHYARTLRLWRDNFFAHEQEIRALGYPDRFMKMWEFYLSYCEGGFTERHIGDVQMLMSK